MDDKIILGLAEFEVLNLADACTFNLAGKPSEPTSANFSAMSSRRFSTSERSSFTSRSNSSIEKPDPTMLSSLAFDLLRLLLFPAVRNASDATPLAAETLVERWRRKVPEIHSAMPAGK